MHDYLYHHYNWHRSNLLILGFDLIPNLCEWGRYICQYVVIKSLRNNIKNVNSGPPHVQSMVGHKLARPLVHSFHHKSILFWKLRAYRTRICKVNKKILGHTPSPGEFSKLPPHKNAEKPKRGIAAFNVSTILAQLLLL